MRSALGFGVCLLFSFSAFAAVPGTDVYLPSVGHGPGSCIGSVCSAWRTDSWIFNSSSQEARVDIFFLPWGSENLSPIGRTVTIAPRESRELADIVGSLFGIDGFGAMRFTSTVPVVVTGRIYDANVVTDRGTGTAGQFFAAAPADVAIPAGGRSAEIVGLAHDADGLWRSNFGFVETAGKPVTIEVKRYDAAGNLVAEKSYPLRARESRQLPMLDVGGGLGTNQRLSLRVTEGDGRILAFGSRIDNRTGDPSTIQMAVRADHPLASAPQMEPAVIATMSAHLPAVGHAPGGCIAGACSQWRSDVWIFNPGFEPAIVEISFLARPSTEGTPPRRSITVAPNETRELADVVLSLFGIDNAFGALRFASSTPVAITGRIFDANVVTNRGTGTAGQFFGATPDEMAIDSSEAIDVIGLALDSAFRTNIGLVETSGNSATVEVQRLDAAGNIIASNSFTLGPRESRQFGISELGGSEGANQRVRARLTGTGRVIGFGSRIDNRTGDPSTIDMLTTLLAEETRTGAIALRLTTPIPASKRPAVVQQRGMLLAAQFEVPPDGSSIVMPESRAGGFSLGFGLARGFHQPNDTFVITLPQGTGTGGLILDPADQVVGTIRANQLARAGSNPVPMVLRLPFTGPCDMAPNDPRIHGCEAAPAKTYPPNPPNNVCQIWDGWLGTDEPLIAYWGSTCQKRVLQGCCPNEGGWFIFKATICCLKNHRGRECQDLQPADLEVRLDEVTAVDLDEPIPFTVHNNGCTGDTIISRSDIGASMTGNGLIPLVAGYRLEHYNASAVAAIQCIEGAGGAGAWVGDRTVTYQLPRCMADEKTREDDDIQFYPTDSQGDYVYKKFRVKRDNLFRFVGGTTLFSLANSIKHGWHIANADAGCNGQHLHGRHPCSGANDPNPNGCGHGRVERAP